MTNWLKKHWLKVLGGVIILIFIYSLVDSMVARVTYNKQIKEKDANISELQERIKESEKREEIFLKSSQEWYMKAMEKEELMRKKDEEIEKIKDEKKALKAKIREMPASQVVARTIEIINCDEVQQQEQGIVFSLSCAKENLNFLEGFSLVQREAEDWREQYSTCKSEVSDLKNSLFAKDGIIVERGLQLGKKDGIISDWKAKFDLSEKRGRRSWWKGIKTGGTIGIITGALLGLFLGGK